ncbi:MAG: alpha/beta hydrolase, partial [Actinobacteria bacterium]|nr:alpha/beta hydrolase [Actinomycetota bacterium]
MPQSTQVYRSERGRELILGSYRKVLAEAPFPWRPRVVTTGGHRTHLIEAGAGDGDPLLLLHGSAANSATFLGDIPVWSREFRVIAADIPGHPGLSEGPPLALSSGETADWLRGFLDAIGEERVRIVGVSLGGWSAMEFACRHPERVRA